MLKKEGAGAYLKGASLRNRSQNSCCSRSKVEHLWRRRATSFACSGATCCLTVTAIFFTLFHFSGSSCEDDLHVVRPTLCSPSPADPMLDGTRMSLGHPQSHAMMSWCHRLPSPDPSLPGRLPAWLSPPSDSSIPFLPSTATRATCAVFCFFSVLDYFLSCFTSP